MKTVEEQAIEFIENAELFSDAAYPVTLTQQYEAKPSMAHVSTAKGLSKREYFAAIALQGALVNPDGLKIKELTKYAVACADSLIDALNKEKP